MYSGLSIIQGELPGCGENPEGSRGDRSPSRPSRNFFVSKYFFMRINHESLTMSNNEANNHTVPSKFAHKNTGIPVAVEKRFGVPVGPKAPMDDAEQPVSRRG